MNNRVYKKLLLICSILFLINQTVYSQDKDNVWVAGVGINVVDIRTPKGIVGVFKGYANGPIEDLNMSGGFIRAFAGRYIKRGISVHLSASANTIKKGFMYNAGYPLINDSFFAMDAKVKYDVNRLIGETSWFDPFLLAGGGYSKIGESNNFNIAAGWGFNLWFSRSVGVNFQSDYNHNPQSTATDYFQHSLGLVFKLNSRPKFKWRDKSLNGEM